MRYAYIPVIALLSVACTSTQSFPALSVNTFGEPVSPASAPQSPASAPAKAEEVYGPGVGESLLQVGGQLSRRSESQEGGETTDSTEVQVQAGVGYFVNEWLEAGGQVLATYDLSDDSDFGMLALAPYVNGNLKASQRVWLYAGPHAGLTYLSIKGTGFSESMVEFEYGVHGGARFWITPRSSLFGELRYSATSYEVNDAETDIDTVSVLFGFNVVF